MPRPRSNQKSYKSGVLNAQSCRVFLDPDLFAVPSPPARAHDKVKVMEAKGDWRGVLRELGAAERRAAATAAAAAAAGGTADLPPRPEPMTVYMYTACITAMSKCKRWKEALDLLDRMLAAAAAAGEGGGGLTPNLNTMSAVITACGRCGQGKAALEVKERKPVCLARGGLFSLGCPPPPTS